jgi:hypothetical protein
MERRRRELTEPAERRALAGRRLMRAGFTVNSGWNGACPSAFINVMWMAIGLYGVFHGTRAHPTPRGLVNYQEAKVRYHVCVN